jgi:hypothetical protein
MKTHDWELQLLAVITQPDQAHPPMMAQQAMQQPRLEQVLVLAHLALNQGQLTKLVLRLILDLATTPRQLSSLALIQRLDPDFLDPSYFFKISNAF